MDSKAWQEADQLTANCTHGMEFAETAEHYADLRTRIRACIAYQIIERDRARQENAAAVFLESTVYGHDTGRIVCSVDLTEHQIAEAQLAGRWYVASNGIGWAMLPWHLTTDKDRAREHGWDNINKAISPTYTDAKQRMLRKRESLSDNTKMENQ